MGNQPPPSLLSHLKHEGTVRMRHWVMSAVGGAALACIATSASAQTPSPEALSLARQLVAKVDPSPQQTISAMAGPMVGMIQQMGVQQPDRAQALVNEAVLPILSEHVTDLADMSAQSYAQVLSVDDLKAVLAFYNTKAGADLIAAQPQLAQLRITNVTQWMGKLQPEIQGKIQSVAKSHGWDKG